MATRRCLEKIIRTWQVYSNTSPEHSPCLQVFNVQTLPEPEQKAKSSLHSTSFPMGISSMSLSNQDLG